MFAEYDILTRKGSRLMFRTGDSAISMLSADSQIRRLEPLDIKSSTSEYWF
jgi:hypothetical protein